MHMLVSQVLGRAQDSAFLMRTGPMPGAQALRPHSQLGYTLLAFEQFRSSEPYWSLNSKTRGELYQMPPNGVTGIRAGTGWPSF